MCVSFRVEYPRPVYVKRESRGEIESFKRGPSPISWTTICRGSWAAGILHIPRMSPALATGASLSRTKLFQLFASIHAYGIDSNHSTFPFSFIWLELFELFVITFIPNCPRQKMLVAYFFYLLDQLWSNRLWIIHVHGIDGGKGLARIRVQFERDSKPSLGRHARIRASTFPRTGDRRSRTRACNTDLSPPRVSGEKTERLSAVGFSPYAHARSHSSSPSSPLPLSPNMSPT